MTGRRNTTGPRIGRSFAMIVLLLAAFASTGVGEESANYSMDYARQQFGASVGESSNYDVQDAIVYAQAEEKQQDSPNYGVSNTLAFGLQANNGLGAGFGTTVHLSWPDHGLPGFQGYDVYRSTSPGGFYAKVNNGIVHGTTYEDKNLENGIYYYIIFAITDGGTPVEWSHIVAAIDGVMPEVWVDFAWQGDQAGSEQAPFRTLIGGATWVSVGGEVKLKPGATAETMRIEKPMRLSNPVPGQTVRIGGNGP
jgi:hypothetical protein